MYVVLEVLRSRSTESLQGYILITIVREFCRLKLTFQILSTLFLASDMALKLLERIISTIAHWYPSTTYTSIETTKNIQRRYKASILSDFQLRGGTVAHCHSMFLVGYGNRGP